METASVLIVEDELLISLEMKEYLQELGHDVMSIATSGEDAIYEIGIGKPDIVLMDIRLSGNMNGIEAARIINSRFDIPIVYITAFTDRNFLEEATLSRPFGYIIKPVNKQDLKITLEMALFASRADAARKKAEFQLQQSEAQYRDLIQLSKNIVMKFDADCNIIFANQFAIEFFGYEEHEMLGKHILETILPEVESGGRNLKKMIRSVVDSPDNHAANENENVCKDGTRVWISWTNQGIYDGEGNLTEIICTGQDITKRRQLEESLKRQTEQLLESQELLNAVFENTYDGILVTELESRKIILINRAMYEMLGYNRDEISEISIFDLNPDTEQQQNFIETFEKHVRKEIRTSQDFPIKKKDGSVFFAEINSAPFSIGSKTMLVAVFRNVTDSRRMRQGLQLAQETSQTGMWELDLVNNHLKWSDGVYKLFELDPRRFEASYEAFLKAIHPEDRARVDQAYQDSLVTKQPYKILHRLQMPDGRIKHVKETCHTEFSAEGKPLHSTGIIQDFTELNQIQFELQESERRLKLAQEVARIGSFEQDIATGEVYWSDETYRLFGYQPGEVKPSRELYYKHIRPDDTRFIDSLVSVTAGQNRINYDFKYVTVNGEERSAHETRITEFDENKVPKRVFGTIQDLTIRRQAEQKLEEQKIMLQALLDSIQESAFLMSPEGEVMFANQTLADRMNTAPERLIGTNLNELLPAELAKNREQAANEVLRTGQSRRFVDYREGRFLENLVYPFRSLDGDIIGLAVLSIDVTERRTKEKELRTLRQGIENSPVSVVITGADGNIEYVNPFFCKNTGYSLDEALGQNPRILKSDHHDNDFYGKLWSEIASGKTWRGEMCNRRKNGDTFWEQVAISPITNTAGDITNFIAVKEDITAKKEMERMKEDVERIMRHDLKTPLSAIIGYPQILLNKGELSEKQRTFVQRIEESGTIMLKMIDLYLDIFKMESGRYQFRPDHIDIVNIIHKVQADIKPQADARGIDLLVQVSRDSSSDRTIWVMGDRVLCLTALSNLVKNAVEASPEKEPVTIDIDPAEQEVRIRIHNQGAVPREMRVRFFEKYATAGKKRGTGLGTYSAKLMIETQGGSIGMETSEAHGTTVTITLKTEQTGLTR